MSVRRAALAALVALAAFVACSPPPPPPPPDAGPPVVCCPPSPQPECCMQIGGAELDGVCPDLSCDIPDPATPGWALTKGADGCERWSVPPGPFACGAPPVTPIEAAPPCAPVSVAGYQPTALTPPHAPANACTSSELAGFYDACVAQDTTSAACAAFQSSDAACSQCLLSQQTDATWGPVVAGLGKTKIDVPGCIALVQGDASATSCAQRASDALGCEAWACDGVCPVTADAGETSYEACLQEAAIGDCHGYVVAQCDTADAGLGVCDPRPLDAQSFAALAAVFCGGS